MYKTKAQKRNALKSIQSKAVKLYTGGTISIQDFDKISKIVNLRLKGL